MDLGLPPEDTVLLVMDLQNGPLGRVPAHAGQRLLQRCSRLVEGARAAHVDLLVACWDAPGMGGAAGELTTWGPEGLHRATASAGVEGPILDALNGLGRRRVVVAGLDAGGSLGISVRDLVMEGFHVHVPQDAVLSLVPEELPGALGWMRQGGAVVTLCSLVLQEWNPGAPHGLGSVP